MTTTFPPASASWMGTVGPQWLSDVLGANVVGVETEPLSVASAAGELARLSLTYEPADAQGPATIIAKAPGSTDIQRMMDAAMGLFARERFVYGELAGALPVRLPRCYHPGEPDKEEPMLLEDLRGLRMGDQVAGLDRADAEGLVDRLADLHAAFWEVDPPAAMPAAWCHGPTLSSAP